MLRMSVEQKKRDYKPMVNDASCSVHVESLKFARAVVAVQLSAGGVEQQGLFS